MTETLDDEKAAGRTARKPYLAAPAIAWVESFLPAQLALACAKLQGSQDQCLSDPKNS